MAQEGGAGGGVRAVPQLRGPTGHRLIWGGEGDQGWIRKTKLEVIILSDPPPTLLKLKFFF